jgi:DNA integrity scanning protein DisA with diadenylate cyclase activity
MSNSSKKSEGSAHTRRITQALLHSISNVAQECEADAVLIYAGAVEDLPQPPNHGRCCRVFYVTKTVAEEQRQEDLEHQFIRVPDVPLTRIGQVKIAVFLGLTRGLLRRGEVVVCLSGRADTGELDTLTVTEVGSEVEISASAEDEEGRPEGVQSEVVDRVIELAAELGSEGREGRPVGALFVVGDVERVLEFSRQMILNPFRGYPDHERNILSPDLRETVKELASIDGAFVIRGDGVVETAGAFLRPARVSEYAMPRGLGARHHAAAAIASLTDAIAITVSQSTGTVTVFRKGKVVLEIERPYGPRNERRPGALEEP